MSERERNILDAAMRAFTRYGVRRTSMSDICEEAGISRQTLYNAYRNKDDILRALIGYYTERAVAEIEAGLPEAGGLGGQLDLVFAKMVVDGFDLTRANPNASDLVEGISASSRGEIEAAAERFRALIERLLAPHEAALARHGVTPRDLSDFVQRAAKAAGGRARDRDHLLAQLATLRKLCLAAAGEG